MKDITHFRNISINKENITYKTAIKNYSDLWFVHSRGRFFFFPYNKTIETTFIFLLIMLQLLLSFEIVFSQSETCGINVSYSINGETITFTKNDSRVYAQWGDCTKKIEDNPVTKVEVIDQIFFRSGDSKFKYLNGVTDMDLSNLDVSRTNDLSGMFRGCSSLINLEVSRWDTSNVIYFSNMFIGCSSLASLDVSNWNTSKVDSMRWMFKNCRALTYLDISRWDTSNVIYMEEMFYGCISLKNLDVSNWNTSNVIYMSGMFLNCTDLIYLNVTKWNTSNVVNMSGMFCQCHSLTNLDVSRWDTSNVNHMGSMFQDCWSLTNLGVSNWDTLKVTVMGYMFFNCYSLTDLDVSNWDTSNLTDHSSMFSGCNNIATLVLGEKSVNTNVFITLPAYNDVWTYMQEGEIAANPLSIGTQKREGTLFSEYDYTTMAGMWTVGAETRNIQISFDSNSGEGEMAPQFVHANVPTALHPNEFIFLGHSFRGWNTEADGSGTSYEDEALISISEDTILYAQWQYMDSKTLVNTELMNVKQDGSKGVPSDLKDDDTIGFSVVLRKESQRYTSERCTLELAEIKGKSKYNLELTFANELPKLTSDFVVELKGLTKYVTGYDEPIAGIPQQTHRYNLTGSAWINNKGIIEIQLIWQDSRYSPNQLEAQVFHPLPEDEIGAYHLNDDGTKEYLLFHTYDICMAWLGSDDLCQSNERCYHK